jgi:hypothetical protein
MIPQGLQLLRVGVAPVRVAAQLLAVDVALPEVAVAVLPVLLP